MRYCYRSGRVFLGLKLASYGEHAKVIADLFDILLLKSSLHLKHPKEFSGPRMRGNPENSFLTTARIQRKRG